MASRGPPEERNTSMTTPWWRALPLRPEVADNAGNIDDVQMSLYRSVYDQPPAPYSDPTYYGAITHPTASLVSLMARIAVRLGGGSRYTSARALYHLDQGMGGGKSHGLIGLYHMVNNPTVFAATDIGQAVWKETRSRLGGQAPDLSNAHVVVLSADHMTPFEPDSRSEIDGPARTLWERLLWRIVNHDYPVYSQYRKRWDQEGIREALRAVNRPMLILVDEIMDYVRQLDDAKYASERNAELAFLKQLFDAVNDVPHVAMVVVMIRTDRDRAVYGETAQALREEVISYLVRNGVNTAVSEAADFSQIIRRRLFEGSAPGDVVAATAAEFTTTSPQWQTILSRIPNAEWGNFPAQVERSYPFHPDLLRLIEREWANLAGYQRVRSTVTLFAQTVYFWAQRAKEGQWAPRMIGPGDLPLDHASVRESLLGSGIIESEATVANYRQVIATDIAGEGGGVAVTMDQERTDAWKPVNPRAAQRMATALLLYSLTPRPGGRVGAVDAEVKAASFVPDPAYAATDAETVFNALTDPDEGLGALDVIGGTGGQPRRYQLTTRQTLQMLFRAQHAAISDQERDAEIAATAERLMQKGPAFPKIRFLRDEPDGKGQRRNDPDLLQDLDERGVTRLVVLDPSRWTLLNGRDDETRQAIRMAFGVGPQALPVTHAASLVVACVNTQRRNLARARATEYLAWVRVARIQVVADDEGLREQANLKIREAKAALEKECRRAFQHYAYLVRDADEALEVRFDKFDEDSKTALSGSNIWDQLVARGRAVLPGNLNMDGLLLNLQGQLPRSLAEMTALFWTNPRMPMLADPDELRKPLFAALDAGQLELINAEGVVLAVPERPADIPLNSASVSVRVRTMISELPDGYEVGGSGGDGGQEVEHDSTDDAGTDGGTVPAIQSRAQLRLKFQTGLTNETTRQDVRDVLSRLRTMADGDLESCVVTLDLIGDESQLKALVEMAKRIHGTTHRVDELPD